MYALFVELEEVDTLRMEAEFYKPDLVEVVRQIRSARCGFDYLGRLVTGIKDGPGGGAISTKDYTEHGVPIVRGVNIVNGTIDLDDCIFISQEKHEKLKSHKTCFGDVILSIRGTIGKAGVFELPDIAEASINVAVARMRTTQRLDPYYLVAFLNSRYGRMQTDRLGNGAVQANMNLAETAANVIPVPSLDVQNAIGNKVRKAARMMWLARAELARADNMLNQDLGIHDLTATTVESAWWIGSSELNGRLDCVFSNPEKLKVFRHLNFQEIAMDRITGFSEISAMVGWKGLTTESYTDSGPYLIRPVNFNNRVLNFDNIVCVEQDKYDDQPQIHLVEGDVVMIKDGNSCGRAMVVPALDRPACAGSTLARLRLNGEVAPYYVEAALNHMVCQVQIQSFITGMAQPHITQEWIAELLIPRVQREAEIAESTKKHHMLTRDIPKLLSDAEADISSILSDQCDTSDLLEQSRSILEWLDANPIPGNTGANNT